MIRKATLGISIASAATAAIFFACSPTGNHEFGAGGDTGSSDTGAGAGSSSSTIKPVPPGSLDMKPDPIVINVAGMDVTAHFTTTSSTDGDVTTQTAYTLDDSTLGVVGGGTILVSKNVGHGGMTVLRGNYGGVQLGSTNVLVNVQGPDIDDPSAPANPGTWFTQGGGSAPSWAYPFDKTMIPRNQPELEFQWNGVQGAGAYRIRLKGQYYSQDIYMGSSVCSGSQCRIKLQPKDWAAVTKAFAGQDAVMTLSASAGPGQPAGSAPPQTLSFSPDDVNGGLYYWSTSNTGIYRVPIGATTAQVFIDHGNQTGCCGCHTVAADGKKVALEFGSADNFQWGGGVVDGTNGQQYILDPAKAIHWNLASFSPDGSQLIINWYQQAQIIDSTTGQKLYDVPDSMIGGKIAQPVWSPDGKSIVFLRYPNEGSGDEWDANNVGDIMMMSYDGKGTFGLPEMIVPSTANKEYHFYPSWTPDSQWIVFDTGTVPCNGFGGGGCMNYNASNTRLRMVRAKAGSVPVDLTRATHMMAQTTNWPRVAPFIQKNGSLIFFTFSANFPYGFVGQGGHPQLWMAAVDLNVAANNPGTDPSYAPFWLTFQNLNENNHLGTWTEVVACKMDSDCPDGFICMNGNCVSDVPK